jgi:uncharacterized protein (DUF4415 family)
MKRKRTKERAATTSRSVSRSTRSVSRSGPPRGEIDTTDIPPLTDEFFRRAVRNPFYRPLKQSTTVRIDADVLAWLKTQGPGYQTRINSLLRAAMDEAIGSGTRSS